MAYRPLQVGDRLAGIGLVPAPIEVLGGDSRAGRSGCDRSRLDLTALLAPEPQQGGFVIAHDDPSVRAADEAPTLGAGFVDEFEFALCRRLSCGRNRSPWAIGYLRGLGAI